MYVVHLIKKKTLSCSIKFNIQFTKMFLIKTALLD